MFLLMFLTIHTCSNALHGLKNIYLWVVAVCMVVCLLTFLSAFFEFICLLNSMQCIRAIDMENIVYLPLMSLCSC